MAAPLWVVLLVLAAFFLLFLDLLVPSGGALLILSLLAATTAVVIAFQHNYYLGLGTLTILFATTPWLLFLAVKIWPKTIIGKLMIRSRPESPEEFLPDTEELRELKSLIGETGITETRFTPSGTIIVRGKRFDANCKTGFIERGSIIQVVGTHLGHLVIVPCTTEQNFGEQNPGNTPLELSRPSPTSSPTLLDAPLTSPADTTAAIQPLQPDKPLFSDWSLEDEKLLDQTLDQTLEGIDLGTIDQSPPR